MSVSKEQKEARTSLNDEIKEQRSLLKGQGWKAYLQYFWDYYRIPTLAVIFGGAIVIDLIYIFLSAKPTAFSAMFINANTTESTITEEDIAADFAEYADISTSDYELTIDTGRHLVPGLQGSDYSGLTTLAFIMTRTASSELDVMVADADNFNYYSESGSFRNLEEFYTEEELSQLDGKLCYADRADFKDSQEAASQTEEAGTEAFYDADAIGLAALQAEKTENYVKPDPSEMEDPIPVGIYVTEAPYIQKLGYYEDTVIIAGISASTKQEEHARKFLDLLLDETA